MISSADRRKSNPVVGMSVGCTWPNQGTRGRCRLNIILIARSGFDLGFFGSIHMDMKNLIRYCPNVQRIFQSPAVRCFGELARHVPADGSDRLL